MDIRQRALDALCLADPGEKAAAVAALWAARDTLALEPAAVLAPSAALPGRPAAPQLIPAVQVPQRSPFTATGLAALLHAIAHIEFNAINIGVNVSKIASHDHRLLLRSVQLQIARTWRFPATSDCTSA